MALKKGDFVEIEFTGKLKGGEVFDSNVKSEIEKLHEGHSHSVDAKPFVLSIGHGMFFKGVEDFLLGKEIGHYEIKLSPENAFGKRDSKLVHIAPSRIFRDQKVSPFPGAVFNFDGRIAKVLSVSGGRITIDFNNPLAGKDVIYDVKVLRKVDDLNEKTKSLIDFFFKGNFKFEISGKKLVIDAQKKMVKFVELFKDKFKEILDLDLEVREIAEDNANEREQGKKSQ